MTTEHETNIHEMAYDAMEYIKTWIISNPLQHAMLRESLASNAIEGNMLASQCNTTLDRLSKNQGVGSQYILGLAWFIKTKVEKEYNPKETVESFLKHTVNQVLTERNNTHKD